MVGWINGQKNSQDGDGVLKSKQIHGNMETTDMYFEKSIAMKLTERNFFVALNSS